MKKKKREMCFAINDYDIYNIYTLGADGLRLMLRATIYDKIRG